jgi:hypothetical protein
LGDCGAASGLGLIFSRRDNIPLKRTYENR